MYSKVRRRQYTERSKNTDVQPALPAREVDLAAKVLDLQTQVPRQLPPPHSKGRSLRQKN